MHSKNCIFTATHTNDQSRLLFFDLGRYIPEGFKKKLKKVITCIIIKVIKVKVVIIMNYYYFHPRLSILPRDCEKEIIKRHKIMEWK